MSGWYDLNAWPKNQLILNCEFVSTSTCVWNSWWGRQCLPGLFAKCEDFFHITIPNGSLLKCSLNYIAPRPVLAPCDFPWKFKPLPWLVQTSAVTASLSKVEFPLRVLQWCFQSGPLCPWTQHRYIRFLQMRCMSELVCSQSDNEFLSQN